MNHTGSCKRKKKYRLQYKKIIKLQLQKKFFFLKARNTGMDSKIEFDLFREVKEEYPEEATFDL